MDDNRDDNLHGMSFVRLLGRTPKPGQATNLHGTSCGGNSERSGSALAGAKCCGPQTVEVRACYATRDKGLGFLGQKRERGTVSGSPSHVFVVNAVAASAGRCQRCAPQERCVVIQLPYAFQVESVMPPFP